MTDRRRTLREYASQREGAHLEFKDPRALKEPYTIAREVCAFLNSDGGEIVIGIGDDGTMHPLRDAEAQAARLRDRLLSLIAPSLPNGVDVELLDGDGIRVTVQRPGSEASLFAVRSRGGRVAVFRRVGDRITALDWAEIRERLRNGPAAPDERSAEKLLVGWREELEEHSVLRESGGLVLACTLAPAIGETAAKNAAEPVGRALMDPSEIGLRREGMHYAVATRDTCAKRGYVLSSGSRSELYRSAQLDLRGALAFATRLDVLLGDRVPGCPRPNTIHPLSLIETIVSCLRLFGTLIESTGSRGTVVSALDLLGIYEHNLPPYRHGTYGFSFDANWQAPYAETSLSEIVRASSEAESFAGNPDRMAHELITWIYEEFGYDSRALGASGEGVPYWDPERERFAFPR